MKQLKRRTDKSFSTMRKNNRVHVPKASVNECSREADIGRALRRAVPIQRRYRSMGSDFCRCVSCCQAPLVFKNDFSDKVPKVVVSP